MKKIALLVFAIAIVLALIATKQKKELNDNFFTNIVPKEITQADIEKDEDFCINKHSSLHCRSLAEIYSNGNAVVEKNIEKSKFYYKILCDKWQAKEDCQKAK